MHGRMRRVAGQSMKPRKRALLPRLSNLLSVSQLVEQYPHLFTEGSLRWMIFQRRQNGFDACIVRIGRKILIDVDQLRIWMAQHRGEESLGDPRSCS